jgi:hypothetical protein
MRKRRADFVTNLIVYDEPHLVYFKSDKAHILAVAVNPLPNSADDYFAATVSQKNWDRYLEGKVDLWYLLSYASQRNNYTFNSAKLRDGSVMMSPLVGALPISYLPEQGIFSDCHTEDFALGRTEGEIEESLFIAGEWGVNEIGVFYQKYSDMYFYSAALDVLLNPSSPLKSKSAISRALSDKPFQGGGSYVQLYDELEDNIPKNQQLALEGITYNSPGLVRVSGARKHLSNVERWVEVYLSNRAAISETHKVLRGYLSKRKLLSASPNAYEASDSAFLFAKSKMLYEQMGLPDQYKVIQACENNPLLFSKIAMSLFRRISMTAGFFAEGRMSFDAPM